MLSPFATRNDRTWDGMSASLLVAFGEPRDKECNSLDADCSVGGDWASMEDAGEDLL